MRQVSALRPDTGARHGQSGRSLRLENSPHAVMVMTPIATLYGRNRPRCDPGAQGTRVGVSVGPMGARPGPTQRGVRSDSSQGHTAAPDRLISQPTKRAEAAIHEVWQESTNDGHAISSSNCAPGL